MKQWFNSNSTHMLLKSIVERSLDYDSFIKGNMIVIEKHHTGALDSKAVDVMSYREWVNNINGFPVIKIEGFEQDKSLRCAIPSILHTVQDVHVFRTNKTGFSFKWHKDNVNVKLLVLKGKKVVYVRGTKYTLKPGQYVDIPKGNLHRVFSTAGTVALSIGLK